MRFCRGCWHKKLKVRINNCRNICLINKIRLLWAKYSSNAPPAHVFHFYLSQCGNFPIIIIAKSRLSLELSVNVERSHPPPLQSHEINQKSKNFRFWLVDCVREYFSVFLCDSTMWLCKIFECLHFVYFNFFLSSLSICYQSSPLHDPCCCSIADISCIHSKLLFSTPGAFI